MDEGVADQLADRPVVVDGHLAPDRLAEHFVGRAAIPDVAHDVGEAGGIALAKLVEVAGLRPQFLLLKESTNAPPQWALAMAATADLPAGR